MIIVFNTVLGYSELNKISLKYYQINLLFPDLNALFLFSPSGEVLAYKYNNTHYFLLENLDYNTWVEPIRDKGFNFFTKDEVKALSYDINGNVLFAGRQLNNLTSNNPACTTIAGLDISDISMAFERHKIFDTQQFACFDSDRKLLFSSKGLNNLSFETIKNQSGATYNGIYYQVLRDKNFNLMRMASMNSGYDYLAEMCELLAKILRYGVSDTSNIVTVQGTIQIWGYKSNKKLIFTVSDNGNGMPEEQLDLLRDYLDDKNTAFKSIGLKNIKKRIQLYYGSEYDLIIESQLYQGTAVTVTL